MTALVLAITGTLLFERLKNGRVTLPKQYYAARSSPAGTSTQPISHVVMILEENKPKTRIVGNASAPYINELLGKYAQTENYFAVTNPSLPNYIALTSGTTAGITNDCNPPSVSCQANVSNITDSIEKSGRSWKAYAESMPAPCTGTNSGLYAVRHNPFMYYPDISSNKPRCVDHVVPFTQFSADLSSTSTLPNYAFVSPNLCSDMHDCSVQTGDTWLSQVVPRILSSPAFTQQHSLLVIVWDEGNADNNNVPIIFAGPAAKRGYRSSAYYSHYSLLHTLEHQWGLAPLTQNDKTAPLMDDMLQQ
jgi:phospholipase C